ncbi:MAG TPA: CheR family methyltransferase, partial [Thermoanaerobaculia bacterium]
RTLADTHDASAVCVILSGTGADGSMGLRRVKEYNGLVLVQDPAEAEFGEMPRSSIATGLVDFVVPVAEMPRRIMSYRDQLRSTPRTAIPDDSGDEQALLEIFTLLRMRTGHDFTNYKRATVLRRIERRLAVREIVRLSDYALFMRATPEEAEALLGELLISVTNFFRDPAVFEQLRKTIVPRLLEGKRSEDHLRVWVPGCATGEEAYSIAMLLADAVAELPHRPDIQIFATDIDEEAIAAARNACYSVAETVDVPADLLRRYFVKDGDGYRVRRELRELVLFAHHNLLKDPPFSHLDLVSCRNLLIYLNRNAQETAMRVIHFALEPGGYLLLGSAETADGAMKLFATVDKEHHIYQSRAVSRVRAQMRINIESNEELQAVNEELRSPAEELETSQEELQSVNEELQTVNQELKLKIEEVCQANDDLRNLMTSTGIGTVFVDRSLRVKLFTPRARDIFNLIPADVGRSLLDIHSKLPMSDLAADIERVLEHLQTVEREVATGDGRWHLMRLLPYRTADDRIDGVVVTFVDISERKHNEDALRLTREELEQRVAERTVQLRTTSAMLQAIIDSSPLAIIAIDTQRNVTTWNASAERMFGLSAEEVLGKPLPNIASGTGDAQTMLIDAMFAGGAQRVYETLLRRNDGTWLNVSVLPAPLRAPDGTVYAVMGLLQDISDRKLLERERERLLRRIVSGQEEERQRIARELHDELGQHLTALKVGLEALRPTSEDVQRLTDIVRVLDRSVDRLTLELRPPALDDVGLYSAIGSLIDQFTASSGIHADVHTTGTDGERLPDAIETTFYRVLQEALTNVWKHAAAKNVSVIIERHPDQVQLIVEDDGAGFEHEDDSDDHVARFGLLGMRERISLIGGSFNIESSPEQGTTLYVRVPLAHDGS